MPGVATQDISIVDQTAESHLISRRAVTLAGSSGKFNAYDPASPNNVNKILVSACNSQPSHTNVKTYNVVISYQDGSIEKLQHDIEVRQDVLGLLIYAEVDGEAQFALTHNPRPALCTRADAQETLEGQTGFLLSLPGAYIDPESRGNLTSAASFILSDKVGLIPASGATLEHVSGTIFTNPRESTEEEHRRAIKVEMIPDDKIVAHGESFSCQRTTVFLTAAEIVAKLISGEIRDLRIVDVLLSFAQSHPELVTLPKDLFPQISLKEHETILNLEERILTKAQVREQLINPETLPRGVKSIVIEEKERGVYLHERCDQASIIGTSGETIGDFKFESVSRSPEIGDDFDCAAICKVNGKIYVLVRTAVRPAIKVRELASHAIAGKFPALHFEGIGGVCSSTLSAVERNVFIERSVKENFGIQLTDGTTPQMLYSGYASAGFNSTQTHLYVGEVNPETVGSWDDSVKLIELEDYLTLSREGTVRDLRLNSAIQLLLPRLACDLPQPLQLPIENKETAALINRFLALLDQGSEIHAWLLQDDNRRKCMAVLSEDPRFRLLLNKAENELGLITAIMNHPQERAFFSPTFAVYVLMEHKLGSEVAVLHFAHDLMHYLIGDYIPTIPPIGAEEAKKHYEDFLKMYHENEVVAGWYSDYILPSILGLEESRRLLGRPSLYEMFEAYGITDEKEAKDIYRSIERDGIIPERLLKDSVLYDRFRNTIIQATLYAQVMFHSHAKTVYENWIKHPRTSKSAADFSDRSFQDKERQMQIFDSSYDEIRKQSEGVNPLKAAVSRVIVRDLQLQIMRLAYFAETLEQRGGDREIVKAAFDKIENAKAIYGNLTKLRAGITNIEVSKENLAVFAELERLKHPEGPLEELKQYVDKFEADFLPADFKAEVAGRIVPFYQPLPFVDKALTRVTIQDLERKSFEKTGLEAPSIPMQFVK